MSYYTNISNPELYYFHNLPVHNFTIKLKDIITSRLFRVENITENIYKIYPLFYTNQITSSNPNDKILNNKCILCNSNDKETYITFIRNNDEEIVDYSNYASYYNINDSLTTNEFNAYVSLLRHNTIHQDTIRIADQVQGTYGIYQFNLDGCTLLDNGIVITDETVTAQPQVRLADNVFHYSTYTLKLSILHYTGVNILDDITPSDFIVVDTIEIELKPNQWIPIPISNIENGYIIDFDTTIEIKHNKPVIPYVIKTIETTINPTLIQTNEPAEIYADAYDNGYIPVNNGYTIHFFEKYEPNLKTMFSPSVIQKDNYSEIYADVRDDDGSIISNFKVHFFEKYEPNLKTIFSPSNIQKNSPAEIFADVVDDDGSKISDFKVHFFEKYERLTLSATKDLIQTDDNIELYCKVKDSDGELAEEVKVYFYIQEEE